MYSFETPSQQTLHSNLASSFGSPDPTQQFKPVHTSTPERKKTQKQSASSMRVLNINCQSIKKKQDRIENILDSVRPDIVIATETWLDPSITNNQFFPSNYKVFRRDRASGSGGGVLVAVRNEYLSEEVPELQTDCEIIWVRINLVDVKNLYICSYYNPKTSDEYSLSQLEESVNRACSMNNAFLFLGGDFNFPGWDWERKVLKPNTPHSSVHNKFADILDDHGLTQLVEEPTRKDSILDLMITNHPAKVFRVEILPGIADHDAVFTELDTRPVTNRQKPRKIPLYKKADWESMRQDVRQIHSQVEEMERSGIGVDEMWNAFQQGLESSIGKHIPHKTARNKDGLPWMTTELKKLLKKKDRLYKKKKKSGDPKHIEEFKALKHLVQKMSRQVYWDYIESLITPQQEPDSTSTRDSSSKRFWTFIKHKRSDTSGIPGLKESGRLETDPVGKANILNRQFKSVFTPKTSVTVEDFETSTGLATDTDNFPSVADIEFSCAGVEKLLKELNPYKGAGPDNIKPRVLKELAPELAPVLTIMYRTSYNTGVVPDTWRTAFITPVYK
ncbi:MAG: endonuclease/exonuclease/phosphatase family protein, partial [Candidatus Thiodiazotropha taylori]|nr:endonuclease/exonuclease/phosphatase family protein [Candidatus Thiodiazotropha taylori]MCW4311018.1 endonuclease/exonuclease/phosphatase family protein [Candidatus Thiodiazotropha endolucinida]